ncbi:MAG: hypothetical protein KJ709_04380 [Nanoarchaeota archaeon]|nr:hypothetical protein [Nanoarchaeota archaeon]
MQSVLKNTTPADLITYSRCPYALFMHRFEGRNKIPRAGIAARGMFFADVRKDLFDVRDPTIGPLFKSNRARGKKRRMRPERYCGRETRYIEKKDREELDSHFPNSSAEKFGSERARDWLQSTQYDWFRGSPLVWMYASERRCHALDLSNALTNYYNFNLDHGVPVIGMLDLKIGAPFEDQMFQVTFPEIRISEAPLMIYIDEPRMGGYKGEKVQKRYANVDESAAITLKMYAFSWLLKNYPHFQRLVTVRKPGLLPELESIVEGSGDFLPNLEFRHINLCSRESDSDKPYGKRSVDVVIEKTKRAEDDLDYMRQLIHKLNIGVASKTYTANTRECSQCHYNLLGEDGRPVCDYRDEGSTPQVPGFYFDPKLFSINQAIDDETWTLTLDGFIEKHVSSVQLGDYVIRRDVAKYTLQMADCGEVIEARSRYDSGLMGIKSRKGTFESRLLQEADAALQRIADEYGKETIHQIDLDHDFGRRGRKAVKKKLIGLGYAEIKDQDRILISKFYFPNI